MSQEQPPLGPAHACEVPTDRNIVYDPELKAQQDREQEKLDEQAGLKLKGRYVWMPGEHGNEDDLRDQFAIAALPVAMSFALHKAIQPSDNIMTEDLAENAYNIANAMLAERTKHVAQPGVMMSDGSTRPIATC